MDSERARVRAAIEDVARAEGGSSPSIMHVCQACLRLMGAGGVCASVRDEHGLYEPLCAAGPIGAALADLQGTVGEGPGTDAVSGDRPVLVTSLETPGAQRQWPLFVPSAAELGATAVFAFPLLVGAIAVGALEIYWTRMPVEHTALAHGLLFADAALATLLSRLDPDGSGAGPAPKARNRGQEAAGDGLNLAPFMDRWPEVHQATGMVAVQMDVRLEEAYARLRAYAYANDRSLRAVARDVVERRLRFSPDDTPEGWRGQSPP